MNSKSLALIAIITATVIVTACGVGEQPAPLTESHEEALKERTIVDTFGSATDPMITWCVAGKSAPITTSIGAGVDWAIETYRTVREQCVADGSCPSTTPWISMRVLVPSDSTGVACYGMHHLIWWDDDAAFDLQNLCTDGDQAARVCSRVTTVNGNPSHTLFVDRTAWDARSVSAINGTRPGNTWGCAASNRSWCDQQWAQSPGYPYPMSARQNGLRILRSFYATWGVTRLAGYNLPLTLAPTTSTIIDRDFGFGPSTVAALAAVHPCPHASPVPGLTCNPTNAH